MAEQEGPGADGHKGALFAGVGLLEFGVSFD